ncbi:metal-dependent hydrolase family protein [Meiothermus rufus]|uniref:metal-dependent hydrolase family protein n=1 Tax=Meiothermus rufus TaxID=604332 RepID=UPI000416B40A|nr:amidohydrolase family protein [Meiothermus rufus]
MAPLLLEEATVLDVRAGRLLPDQRVVLREGRIARLEPMEAPAPEAQAPGVRVLKVRGLTLLPGLIDAHVHVMAWTANLRELSNASPHYNALCAAQIMREMLRRGFTTVRDAAGADFGLKRAVEEGLLEGPRLYICGRALSQTGGHGDVRGPGEEALQTVSSPVAFGRVADGVPEVRRAAREEIRRGADQLKLMLGGGIASPTDRLTNDQFSREEIAAAVEEAEMADLYVMAHAYTARAVNRALEAGVRSIEHGNLIDESSVERFLRYGAWLVPTLVTYQALAQEGVTAGLPREVAHKIDLVLDKGLAALELAYRAGVNLAYGTDLLGSMHRHQLQEFTLRAQVQPNLEVIRAATLYAARLLRAEGQLGELVPGAYADLIAVAGNPLEDLGVLTQPERYLQLVIKGGRVYLEAIPPPSGQLGKTA